MNFTAAELIVFVLGQVVVAAAIYGGIRADIRNMHWRLSELERRFEKVIDAAMTWHGEERRRPKED